MSPTPLTAPIPERFVVRPVSSARSAPEHEVVDLRYPYSSASHMEAVVGRHYYGDGFSQARAQAARMQAAHDVAVTRRRALELLWTALEAQDPDTLISMARALETFGDAALVVRRRLSALEE